MLTQPLKYILLSLAILVAPLLFGGVVAADSLQHLAAGSSSQEACDSLRVISPENGSCAEPGGSSLNRVITVAVDFLSIVGGVIGVIMLIIAGLKFITADGDSTKMASAKNTIIYAAVGLVVVAFAQLIVRFVLNRTA